MANMIERFLDFMKLSYDDDYDEEEENETYEEPIKTRGIKNKEKDKTDSISKDSRKGTQAVDRTSRKEGKSQNR